MNLITITIPTNPNSDNCFICVYIGGHMCVSPYLCISVSAHIRFYVSPYISVSMYYLCISVSPYFRISVSPYLRISASPYLRISVLPYLRIIISLHMLCFCDPSQAICILLLTDYLPKNIAVSPHDAFLRPLPRDLLPSVEQRDVEVKRALPQGAQLRAGTRLQ